jgi:hypothetical protein
MKIFIFILSSFFLTSCSTSKVSMNLSQKIEQEEVRSLKEIQSHIEFLLKSHPELDFEARNKLSAALDAAMAKQQELKNEESKIFQLLIRKSLKVDQLTDKDLADKSNLKVRLKVIYDEKYKNILNLITNITVLSDQEYINESVNRDMMYLLRDLR